MVVAVGEGSFLHHLATLPPRGLVGVALSADGRNPVELPAILGREWIGMAVPVSEAERAILPPDTGYSKIRYASSRGAAPVFMSIVLSGRDRTSIHRPELCLVGQGWTITVATKHVFRFPPSSAGFPATLLHVEHEVRTANGSTRVPQLVAYWFVAGDAVAATHWKRMALDAWNRVVHGRADRWAYVLIQTDAADGEAAALARMQTVLDATLPSFQRVR
jgi:EpsI family protein